jgi:hypothetical protein
VVRKNSAAKPSNTNVPVPRFNVVDFRIVNAPYRNAAVIK